MRNKASYLWSILFLSVVSVGCNRSERPPFGSYIHIESIIQAYVQTGYAFFEFDKEDNALYMAVSNSSDQSPTIDKQGYLEWDFENIITQGCWDTECTDEECVKFRQLSKKNGDVKIDEWVDPAWANVIALAHNFKSITITSNKDFDTTHPAGTSMGDIISVSFESYKSMIENGFSGAFGLKTKNITTKIQDLTLQDLSVVRCPSISSRHSIDTKKNHTFKFTFETLPTLEQQHTLDIVFVSDEDEEFRFKVDVDFTPTIAEVEEEK